MNKPLKIQDIPAILWMEKLLPLLSLSNIVALRATSRNHRDIADFFIFTKLSEKLTYNSNDMQNAFKMFSKIFLKGYYILETAKLPLNSSARLIAQQSLFHEAIFNHPDGKKARCTFLKPVMIRMRTKKLQNLSDADAIRVMKQLAELLSSYYSYRSGLRCLLFPQKIQPIGLPGLPCEPTLKKPKSN